MVGPVAQLILLMQWQSCLTAAPSAWEWDRWDFINIYFIINPCSAGPHTGGRCLEVVGYCRDGSRVWIMKDILVSGKQNKSPLSKGLALLLLWWDILRSEYRLWINWALPIAMCTQLWELEDGSLTKCNVLSMLDSYIYTIYMGEKNISYIYSYAGV